MDRGAWLATVHGVNEESDTTEQLNTHALNQQNSELAEIQTFCHSIAVER